MGVASGSPLESAPLCGAVLIARGVHLARNLKPRVGQEYLNRTHHLFCSRWRALVLRAAARLVKLPLWQCNVRPQGAVVMAARAPAGGQSTSRLSWFDDPAHMCRTRGLQGRSRSHNMLRCRGSAECDYFSSRASPKCL